MVRHIVMWRLKETKTELESQEAKNKIIESLLALKDKIEVLQSIDVKTNAPEAAGNNFDVVLDTTFNSLKDLDNYQVHPEHIKVVNIVKPLVKERAAIDYEF